MIFGFIALSFTRNTGIAIKTEIALTERLKNVYAARGACLYATQMLIQSGKQKNETKSDPLKKLVESTGIDTDKKDKSNYTWHPSTNPYLIRIGDRDCYVFINDESGKINVNKVTDETRTSFVKFLTAFKLEELTAETITDSILDWLDKDDLHHINGAEKDFYTALPEPYEPKNGPFDSIEELALIKGVTPRIYELLRDHLTIYGPGKINVNYASKKVLLYIPTITPEIAEAIIQFRDKNGKIKRLDELKEILGQFGIIGADFQKITNYLTIVDSNYMTINSISYSNKMKNSYKIVILKKMDYCKIISVYPE